MDETSVAHYITNTFANVQVTENFGYTFFFYSTERIVAFATMSSSDNEHDNNSNLDRSGVFRLNIGVSKETYIKLFGEIPNNVKTFDYTALDVIMPHPVYAPQSFVCILNPSQTTFETVKELLAEAYALAVKRHIRKNSRESQE